MGELLEGARWPEGLGAFLVRSCYQTSGNAKDEDLVDLEWARFPADVPAPWRLKSRRSGVLDAHVVAASLDNV
jgi:hypothetical protein